MNFILYNKCCNGLNYVKILEICETLIQISSLLFSTSFSPSSSSLVRNTEKEREREMFYLTTHSTHFIYGYMASVIWLRTILIVRKETRCRHIGYSYRLTARVLLYAPSHRQDNTYHGLCYTSRGALAGGEIAQWVHPMKDRSDDPSHHERTLYL